VATSSEAFKSFKSAGTLVYANSKKHWNSLPKGAREIQGQAGGTIPIVLVTTADANKGLKAFSYKAMSADMRKAVRELRDFLETADVLGGGDGDADADSGKTADKPDADSDSDDDLIAETQVWTNSKGQAITAGIRAVTAGKVLFVMPGGKVVEYPLIKLSDESQKKIEELTGG
jgi:hypothetical protein